MTTATMYAMSVDRVGEAWEAWQRRNEAEAKQHNGDFMNRMLRGDARKAIGWHIRFVAECLGTSTVIVSEYVRRNRHD